jgi:hypothetical protein
MLWASESVEYLATVKRFLRSSKWAIFAIIDGSAQENCTLRMCLYQPLPLGRRFLSAAKLNVEQPTSSDQRRTTNIKRPTSNDQRWRIDRRCGLLQALSLYRDGYLQKYKYCCIVQKLKVLKKKSL